MDVLGFDPAVIGTFGRGREHGHQRERHQAGEGLKLNPDRGEFSHAEIGSREGVETPKDYPAHSAVGV